MVAESARSLVQVVTPGSYPKMAIRGQVSQRHLALFVGPFVYRSGFLVFTQRRGVRLPYGLLTIGSLTTGSNPSTRDVRVASLLAMQDVRVRFPLGALILERVVTVASPAVNREVGVRVPALQLSQVPLAERPRHRSSKPNRRVQLPQGTLVRGCRLSPAVSDRLGDRLMVGFLALNQETEVRVLLPELIVIRK